MIKTTHNPYNFGRPIQDPELFAGRINELKEIDYYLDIAVNDNPTYFNLALIGPRAVGKTSLLNMIQSMAEKKKIIPVKISLNEEISNNEILFFKEIFDNIITASAKKGAYGGIKGKTYSLYRKVIDLLETNIEIPFLFGKAYIGFKQGKNTSYSQQVLIHDFNRAYEEVKTQGFKGIAILLDECDLLSHNKGLLQKIRNIFGEITGYMLIFSGTEKMFPEMNDVFSPLPRVFKRIDVTNFTSLEDTKDCIIKPLNENERKIINQASIAEIHVISNGNPYEIQLLSHFMYKKYVEEKTEQISLDVDVLDKVLIELERLRKSGHHKTADRIKQIIHPKYLKALIATLESPNSTKEELSIFLVLSDLDKINIEDISSEISFYKLILKDMIGKIITINDDDRLNFAGDEFDILYLKHFALSKGIKQIYFGFGDEQVMYLQNAFVNLLLRDLDEYEIDVRFDKIGPIGNQDGYSGQKLIFGGKFKSKPTENGKYSAVMEFSPAKINQRFYEGSPDGLRFRVNIDYLKSGFVIQIVTKRVEDQEYIIKRLNVLKIKLQVIGINILEKDEIYYNLEGVKLIKEKKYEDSIIVFKEGLKINENFELLWTNMGNAYFEMKLFAQALPCYEKWRDLRPRESNAWERIGATLINLKEMEEAKNALQNAVKIMPESAVAWDNLGRALFHLKLYDESINAMNRSLNLNPNNYIVNVFVGISYHNLLKYDEAIKMYDLVLKNDPDNHDALLYKGIAFFDQKKYDDSIKYFTDLLEKDPNNIIYIFALITMYDEAEKYEEVIKYCNKIITLDSENILAYIYKAYCNVKMDNQENAVSDLKRAIEIKPNLIELLKSEKDFDKIMNLKEIKDIIYKISQIDNKDK